MFGIRLTLTFHSAYHLDFLRVEVIEELVLPIHGRVRVEVLNHKRVSVSRQEEENESVWGIERKISRRRSLAAKVLPNRTELRKKKCWAACKTYLSAWAIFASYTRNKSKRNQSLVWYKPVENILSDDCAVEVSVLYSSRTSFRREAFVPGTSKPRKAGWFPITERERERERESQRERERGRESERENTCT